MNNRRVYWHGVFPDFNKQGTLIGARGTLNHEVQWDDAPRPTMVPVDSVKPLGAYQTCRCGRCGGTR